MDAEIENDIYQNEREAWNYFRLDTPECIAAREDMAAGFSKLFLLGHRHSLRELIVDLEIGVRENLFAGNYGGFFKHAEDIHPDAFRVINRYGVDYTPRRWNRPPNVEPRSGKCYSNAWRLAKAHRASTIKGLPALYVEGIAFGPVAPPMLHAWVGSDSLPKEAIDWSWYAGSHWVRYRGIPFTVEERRKLGWVGSALFTKENFPRFRLKLISLLAKRKRA